MVAAEEDRSLARMASLTYATMWECGNVGGEGAFPSYISMSNIEHFDATSKSSMPRRKVRRHVEQFDATSRSSMPNIEKLDATHQTARRHVIDWRFHGRLLPPSQGVIALVQKWLQRRAGGRRTSLNIYM